MDYFLKQMIASHLLPIISPIGYESTNTFVLFKYLIII